jgi:uncharacterized protein YhfF
VGAPPGGARPLTDLPDFGLGYPGTDLRQRLLEAVLAGAKTTTSGLHGDDDVPSLGQRYSLQDAAGVPRAIVEVTDARVVPAGELDLQFIRDEGEGFESLEDWRAAHERFFERPIPNETLIEAIRFRVVEKL